jgi:hypothetical protein
MLSCILKREAMSTTENLDDLISEMKVTWGLVAEIILER